jgi:hypothetical protein
MPRPCGSTRARVVGATHTDAAGAVIVQDGRQQLNGLPRATAGITGERVRSMVAGRLGRQPASAELVVVPGATAKLAWVTYTSARGGTVRSLLDASTGTVLKEERTVREADGRGRVFDPNPVVRLQNEALTDNNNADSPVFKRAYRSVRLAKLDRGKTTLQGAYADNVSENPVTSPRRIYDYNRVMDWDSTSYTDDTPHCLRRTDGPKVYPGDLDGEVHDDGEIWSHALWDVNRALGRTAANRVILESQFSFTPDVSMPAAAQLTVTTARALYGAKAAAKTRTAFQQRGILS